jgi:glutamine amidotransferase
MIAILDYKAGNLTSVQRALMYLGLDAVITNDVSRISRAHRIIFPGVGAAGKAMTDLKKLGLDEIILEAYHEAKPILGICLGTQIILESSEENDMRCLGLIKGEVLRFPGNLADHQGTKLKVPHMGWNGVELKRKHFLFEGVHPKSEFYFVHSYYPVPADPLEIMGETDYGIRFASFLVRKNLVAVQFHPEKSGRPGLRVLSNFCRWDGQDNAQ